jgi:DNA-binding transcriptional LysR family regulator
VWEPPPRIPRLVQTLQWHRHRNNDPAIRWLRDLAVEVARHV